MPNINIITGVSSGIGKCIAAKYLAKGETVIGVVRDLAALSKIKELSGNRNITFVVADLSKPDFIEQIINAVPPNTQIKHLIHCAAELGPVGSAAELKGKEAEIDKAMRVNCNAPIALTKALMEFFVDDARILFTGSDYAKPSKDPKCFEIYAKSKKDLYTKVTKLREELIGKVRINIFNPGPTDTPLFAEFWAHIRERYESKSISPSRPSSPAKVAESLINLIHTSNEVFSREQEWEYSKLQLTQPSVLQFFAIHQVAAPRVVAQPAVGLAIRSCL